MLNKIKPTSTLPAIIAIIGRTDAGEYGATSCPHCGALGRYITYFICEDGKRHGAMSGCIQLFPKSNSRIFKLMEKAFAKADQAKDEGKKLASWWSEMIEALEAFGDGKINQQEMVARIQASESRRQDWLYKNGYGPNKYRR